MKQQIQQRTNQYNDLNYFGKLRKSTLNSLTGLYYNLETFTNLSNSIKQFGKVILKNANLNHNITLAIPDNKLTFEYEHFTFRSITVINRLCNLLSYYFETKIIKPSRLVNYLKNKYKDDIKALNIAKIFEKHEDYLNSLFSSNRNNGRSERDTIAHYFEIDLTVPNIVYNPCNPDNTIYLILEGTGISDERDVVIILNERYNQLDKFVKEILDEFYK